MALADRIQDFLQRLTPLTRNCLLTELERLEMSEGEMPGSAEILAKLRAEFRKDGSTQNRVNNPSRYFFAPLEPLLVDGAPEHANSGRITARFAGCDLGVDQPRSVADDGARLRQADRPS